MTMRAINDIHKPGSRRIGRINGLGLWTVYEKEVRRFLKVWMQTIGAPAVQAILFFLIFAVVLGGSDRVTTSVAYTQFLAPGLIIMALLQNSFANTSSSLIIAKVQGTIVDVLMPPLSPAELTLGFVAGGVTRGLTICAVLIGCFALLPIPAIMITHPLAILYFGAGAAIMLSLMGILTGIWAEKFDHVATITNFIVGPLTLLSGTFYSIDRLKEKMGSGAQWLEPILAFNPFFYMIDGFRYGFIGEADSSVLTGAIVIAGIDVLLWVITWRALKSGWRLKS
ncbi:transport permease protein [Iodidimonas muriae]|uniref:Transport permease protein n=1 Tax=Iodidimonas muriae TaxID=261467 RepID=A0ABQ2L8P8_9PROT|nr:ABC transporter permease [Iodidimonas muriae]GER05841.1 transport permease protein [Kordiimonadales bacterium JCM 17843]GGO07093.1 transport permease protein [Iodidimonas muriae]